MVYDVIIVGGGPSGLTAAMTAAAEGLKVLLVDSKEHIARYTRPCCSMWLLDPGFHNEGWTFKDNKIFFHRHDFAVPYAGDPVDLYRSVRIASGGHVMLMGKRLTPVAKVIDKNRLLQGLFERVVETGIEIRSRTTCIGIAQDNNSVFARLRHNGADERVAGKYLIAADGVDSRVVQTMGLNSTRRMLIRTPLLSYYFADVQTPYEDSWVQFIDYGFNGVSGSMLHKPDRPGYSNVYEIGAYPPPGAAFGCKEGMQRLTSHPILKEWLSGSRLIEKKGCRWTIWTPITDPARGRVIITGDAAAFQEVENQGAIMCGYRAAKAIAARENGRDGFADYNRFWMESFEFNDPKIMQNTWKGFIFRFLGSENIDYLLGLSEGIMLDGYVNHFTSGGIIFEFILSRMSQIEKERPALAEQIKKFQNFKFEEHMFGNPPAS